ncbi:MAG: radical SAM protein [Elusimicrobiota bacterium]
MRYNKVLLLNFSYDKSIFKVPKILAGLGYIAEFLKYNNIEYDILDMSLGYKENDLYKKIENFRPDLIGISLMTYRYLESYEKINGLKKKFKDIKIVVGGPHVSLFREETLKSCNGIDYGIVLEGEQTIVEICSGIELDKIKGLIFRTDGEIIFNGERAFISDLDSIPFPTYDKFELLKYPYKNAPTPIKDISIVSSRGCPFSCIYCPVQSAIGKKFRYRSPENIIREIKYWYDKGYRTFWFADDNFTLLADRVNKICDLLKESVMTELVLGCGNGIRADKVNRELLEKMKEVGFKTIAFGVEAGTDKILQIIKKGETLKDIDTAIKDTTELGFSVMLFFLIGSPNETVEDIERSFELAKKYPVEDVKFYHITPYPKTELYDWVIKNNYFVFHPSNYLNDANSRLNIPIFETPELSVKERKRLFLIGNKISWQLQQKYYQKKFLVIGVPRVFAIILSKIYQIEFLHKLINYSPVIRDLKDFIAGKRQVS